MIHEFIDNNKKKIIKSKKLLFNDYSSVKNSSDGTNFQANHSECDSKDIDNESSHVSSDQKSSKLVSKYKKSVEDLKLKTETDRTDDIPCVLNSQPGGVDQTDTNTQCSTDGPLTQDTKPLTVFWVNPRKSSESTVSNLEIKIATKNNFDVSHAPVNCGVNRVEKNREDGKKRLQIQTLKQKNKNKKRNAMESFYSSNQHDPSKNMDQFLEAKARDIINNYTKKEVHTVSSDMKQLEAKLIILASKCRGSDTGKLSAQEFRLLQKVKQQMGNEEEYEKLMKHIKETNFKEWLKISNPNKEKEHDEDEAGEEREGEEVKEEEGKPRNGSNFINDKFKIISDKDSLKSTDVSENDVKKQINSSSNNKNNNNNNGERKKGLQELKNYFDKKKIKLSGRHFLDDGDGKIFKLDESEYDNKKILSKDKIIEQDSASIFSTAKDQRKFKFIPCNEEVVEKAVSETLQKFMSLYHFHISPNMISSVRKNILQAMQVNNLNKKMKKKNQKRDNNNMEEDCDKKPDKPKKPECDLTSSCNSNNNNNNSIKVQDEFVLNTVVHEDNKLFSTETSKKNDCKNIEMDKYKKEIETRLRSIYCHAEETGFKIKSLIFEKNDNNSSSSSPDKMHFAYNYSKKSLEVFNCDRYKFETVEKIKRKRRSNRNRNRSSSRSSSSSSGSKNTTITTPTTTVTKDIHTQTSSSNVLQDIKSKKSQNIQTIDPCYKTCHVQTINSDNEIKGITELGEFNLLPGLYRMVKSRKDDSPMIFDKSLAPSILIDSPDIRKSEKKFFRNYIGELIRKNTGCDLNELQKISVEAVGDTPLNTSGMTSESLMEENIYRKDDGDIEVDLQIDLTLNDLEKILRGRHKRLRRRRHKCKIKRGKKFYPVYLSNVG
ncbi:golgin IMH1, putative [Pediculus humanus corporis]|uniref:Golgin IMH1, putative n=1 Tax=Pediculus humanus subsp. corporis TaxID=121224 RepID=E0VJG8_PEDHC|nr:golgin IMH1, putative [Pediculus humanus corporis]EEB13524.1 golgin IMH1, putative [Pediculus humanus corporis]